MKVLIAPNAFKGTIEAEEAAEIIAGVIQTRYPGLKPVLSPIADGGDGTCYLLGKTLRLKQDFHMALNPLGSPVKGFIFTDKRSGTVYLDVSTVSGIRDLKGFERKPWITSSYGTGELILEAVHQQCTNIILGLGGSATIDMGLGILRALGYIFLDDNGREFPLFSEGLLTRVRHIQGPQNKPEISFTFLCDVNNTFLGNEGAIPVFGPQKGLEPQDIESYEEACRNVIRLLENKSGKTFVDRPGYGAAGGIALGLSFFFPTAIEMGAKWFFEQTGMETKVRQCDLVITGEGRYDSQSAGGKGSFELLQLAKKHGKKTVLITSGKGGVHAGFDQVVTLADLDFTRDGYREQARNNLIQAVQEGVHL